MTTLLIAEHDDATVKDATAKALTAAKALGAPVHILVAGHGCKAAADAAAKLDGVAKVLLADDAGLGHMLAETVAALVAGLAGGYTAIVAPSTANGKNVAPRIAALIDSQIVSDVMKVVSPDTFERPIYAGNAIQTVQSSDKVKVLTIRTASFQPASQGGSARSRPWPRRRTPASPPSRARRSPSPTGRSSARPRSSSRAAARSARPRSSGR